MYAFAIVVLLGIGTFKLVDTVSEYRDVSAVRTLITLVAGVLLAWALDFSVFEAWDIAVRSELLGYAGTGLMIAAAGYAVAQIFGSVAEVVAPRPETRVSRAA